MGGSAKLISSRKVNATRGVALLGKFRDAHLIFALLTIKISFFFFLLHVEWRRKIKLGGKKKVFNYRHFVMGYWMQMCISALSGLMVPDHLLKHESEAMRWKIFL